MALLGETVLLVEDNEGVREYARSALEELGYKVLEASDAAAATRILDSTIRIDLLFTEVAAERHLGPYSSSTRVEGSRFYEPLSGLQDVR